MLYKSKNQNKKDKLQDFQIMQNSLDVQSLENYINMLPPLKMLFSLESNLLLTYM